MFTRSYPSRLGLTNPNHRLFGCRGELPSEGLPTITKIPVASFEALQSVRAVSREDQRLHLEGVPPFGWQMMPCERLSNKEADKVSPAKDSPSFCPTPPLPSSIWKGSSESFLKNSSLLG